MLEKEKKETYNRWKELVNMSKSELQKFYNSKEGKSAGLTAKQANDAGIDSGRESARWIMKMKDTPVLLWTPTMWKWANKQISFISRMSGMKGKLYDENGNKTRKYLALLIWGNNPEKYEKGGEIDEKENILNAKDEDYVYVYHASTDPLSFISTSTGKNYRYSTKGVVYVATNPNNALGYVKSLGKSPFLYKIKIKKKELLPDLGFIKTHGGKKTLKDSINLYGLATVKRNIYGNEMELMPIDKYEKGGELNKKNMSNKTINPDATIVKNYFGHNSGSAGGLLVGNRHSEGGIKAINKSTGNPIEMEGGEVVITRPAVSDNSKRQFEGEMLTNREILSKINQSGGGVAIMEDGGSLKDYNCSCTGHKYNYGGNLMDDHDIVKQIHEEERIKERQAYYRSLPTTSYQDGGEIAKLTDTHKKLLKRFDNGERIVVISKKEVPGISYLEDKALIYITPNTEDHTQMDVFITEDGKRFIDKQGSDYFKYGGTLPEELKLAEGGSISKDQSYYKGTNHSYENQFLINKAIEALIESVPGELMTPEEKNFVGYYAGYGGLEKYGASGKGLLYEYFTPSVVAKKMWGLAYKHGFEGGKVLEPSCGIGEFIKYAPDQRLVTGYEINDFSAKICRILYPNAKIVVKPFETIFIKNNNSVRDNLSGIGKYSLVIGNPPYGSMGGIYAGMGEKKYTKANNYIEYFISRGLDLLESGGLLIYIIGTEVAAGGKPFLQQPNNPLKGEIAEKASLVDAYRLFNGLFDTTDVLTDIVVFKKK